MLPCSQPVNRAMRHCTIPAKLFSETNINPHNFNATAITHCAKEEAQFNGTRVEMRTQHGNLQLKLVHSDSCSRLGLNGGRDVRRGCTYSTDEAQAKTGCWILCDWFCKPSVTHRAVHLTKSEQMRWYSTPQICTKWRADWQHKLSSIMPIKSIHQT